MNAIRGRLTGSSTTHSPTNFAVSIASGRIRNTPSRRTIQSTLRTIRDMTAITPNASVTLEVRVAERCPFPNQLAELVACPTNPLRPLLVLAREEHP
jgi:hypothetical protein